MNSHADSHYRLSTTEDYHRQDLKTLGWELTVCNSLYPEDTPIRKILVRNASYGDLLYEHLEQFVSLENVERIIEIGGGYGYLMRDFLTRNNRFHPCMLDISPVLLAKQKETLSEYSVSYRLEDALMTDTAFLWRHEIAIMNENLGDFPTLIDIDTRIFDSAFLTTSDDMARRARHFFDTYGLARPVSLFNLNIGAMEMTEKLCQSAIPCIFLAEHSCEAEVPSHLRPFIHLTSDGNPKKIQLKGHDEYTIRFSYLEKIAHYYGYKTIRGPIADYIIPEFTEYLKAVLLSRGLYSDSEEMICQFVGDLHEYEYLILIKK